MPILVTLLLSSQVHASDRLFTYFEGVLRKKSDKEWVLETEDGTYWLNVRRQPSWVTKLPEHHISFWISVGQITRFRPFPLTPERDDHVEKIAQQPVED